MANNNDKAWYDNLFRNGLSRADGGKEIAESNALDWQRLRILKDGKLIPFMRKDHIGPMSDVDIKVLREEAQKGNVFLYRMGESYPHRLIEEGWYSMDPASKEEKEPKLKLPKKPQLVPYPFERRLKKVLEDNGFPADTEIKLADNLKDASKKMMLHQISEDLNAEKKRYEKNAERIYQERLKKYEAECDRLSREFNAEHQEWKKRIAAFDKLDANAARAISEEERQRKIEIVQNQEVQRAETVDLMGWYHNEFRVKIVRPRTEPMKHNTKDKEHERLAATQGIDWNRMRIWDGKEFVRVLPEDHKGPPTTEALKHLREAAKSGNLFMYTMGVKYPSKWMGNQWATMDKGWIDKQKPAELKLPKKPEMNLKRPVLDTTGISNRKVATYRFFSRFRLRFYKAEWEKFNNLQKDYEEKMSTYQKAVEKYHQDLEKYDEDVRILREAHAQKRRVYNSMLKNYEGLTADQKIAMENDAEKRAEEIKQNKEVEQKKAHDLTEQQRMAQDKVNNAVSRADLLDAKPKEGKFIGGEGALNQNVYDIIAPHRYDLPANSKISIKDAAVIHLALAGSTQAILNHGLAPMDAQRYGQMMDGILYGNPTAEELQYITSAYDAAKGYIASYSNGQPKPLAEAMSEGLRNLMSVSRDLKSMSPEMAGLGIVAGRIIQVLDKNPELMNNCLLSGQEMEFARGMVQLSNLYYDNLEAQIKLTNVSTGAKQYSKEEIVGDTVNLVVGSNVQKTLSTMSEEKQQQMVGQLGKLNGQVLTVAIETYKNDEQIQNIATDPKLLMNSNMDERLKTVSQTIVNSDLSKPKESEAVQTEVKANVKMVLQEQDPKVVAQKTEQELKRENELTMVRDLLASQNPKLGELGIEDEIVTKKHKELAAAQRAVAERIGNEQIAMNDPEVLKEAEARAKVQELINSELKDKKTFSLSAGNVDKRMASIRQVWEKLSKDDPNLSLTDDKVIAEERRLQEEKGEKTRRAIKQRTEAADVIQRETGIIMNAGDKFTNGGIVGDRVTKLKQAREALGAEYKDLPLNDMKVIQKDYRMRRVDPLKTSNTIVDEATLTGAQKTEYRERMETISYLRQMNTPKVFPNSRYEPEVEKALAELRAARAKYEATVQGNQKGLPLDDMRIGAMHALERANGGNPVEKPWKDAELQDFGNRMKGQKPEVVENMAREQLQNMGKEIGKKTMEHMKEQGRQISNV